MEASHKRWCKKKCQNVLLNNVKMINPRVKSQNCQIYFLRALKWGIVHLCILYNSRDTKKFRKSLVFQFLHFCKEIVKSLSKTAKNVKIQKNHTFIFQSYLQYNLTYIGVQCLIWKLLKNYFYCKPEVWL